MVWIYTERRPAEVSVRTAGGMRQYTVNYSITMSDDGGAWRWKHKSVTLEPGVWHYDAVVCALVDAEYPRDKMSAVVNNWLADPSDPCVRAEFQAMQGWRTEAKATARRALEIADSMD